MRGSHRHSRRRTRLLALNITGLAVTLALALGQFGLVAAGATDRDRDGSFSSDTEVVTTDKDPGASSGGASSSSGGSIQTRDDPVREPRTHGGPPNPNITICHATNAAANPYIVNTPDASSIVTDPTGHSTHVGNPVGPFDPTVDYSGNKTWGDIIPPFVYDDANGNTQNYPGLNWTAAGQAIWNAGCQAVASLSTPVKSAPGTVAVGTGGHQFTISVTNNGGNTATNVIVTDTVNAAFTVTAVTFTNPNGNGSCPTSNNVSCNVGTLQPGQTAVVTITFTAPPNSCPTVLNTAAARIGTGPATNSNQTSTTVTGCAAVLATPVKSGPASVPVGSAGHTYTLSTTNTGNATASDVTFTDTVNAAFTVTAVSFSKSNPPAGPTACAVSNNVSCNVGTLLPGQSATVTITFSVPANAACTAVPNTGAVAATGIGSQNTNTVTTDVTGCGIPGAPDISITKSGPTQVNPGQQFSYTITVTNLGNADALGVTVSDTVPLGLTIDSVSPTPACGFVGQVVSCSLGTVSSGNPVQVTITVTPTTCGPFANSATVATRSTNDSNPNNHTAGPVNTTVDCRPGLTILKTAAAAVVQPGDPVSFSITVTSTGSAAADNVVMTDTLPTIPGTTWSITGGNGAGSCGIGAGNVLTCNYGSVPSGTSLTVVVSTTATTAAACGTYVNTATADASNTQPVSSSASVEVDCPAASGGVNLTKSGPASAKVGDTIAYTFTVTLTPGSPDLSGFTFTDPVCDPGTISGPTGDDGDGVLEGGETWGFSCTHVVTATDPDPLSNTATFCATDPSGATVCDSDNHEVDVRNPAIDVEKSADPTSGSPGDVITFTYTVTNAGDVPLFDVSVDDDVLGHICDIAVLDPGETVVCTGTYVIPQDASGTITNIVIASGTDPAGDVVEDQDDFTITVVAGETVTPTKTPPGGVAFTGPATAIPIATVALLLLMAGTALLWLGRHRGRIRREGPTA